MEMLAIGVIAILIIVAEIANRRKIASPREILQLRARLTEEMQFRSDIMKWIEDECGNDLQYRGIKANLQKKYMERQDLLLINQAWRNNNLP